MRRKIVLLLLLSAALLLLWAGSAFAELSTNLQLRTELHPKTRRVLSQTYVDAAGNPVAADDKGYATVRYEYTDKGKVALEEYLDAAGVPVNCRDGRLMSGMVM